MYDLHRLSLSFNAFAFMFTLEWNSFFQFFLSLVVTSLNRLVCVHSLLSFFHSVSLSLSERNLHQGFVVGHFW